MLFRYFIPYLQYPLVFSHCWSLSIEEQYYLVFPFTFLFLCRYLKGKTKFNFISTFFVFNLLFIALIVVSSEILTDHFYKFFLWRFFEIFFGVYISLIYNKEYHSMYPDTWLSRKITHTIVRIYKNKFVLLASVVIFFYLISTNGFPYLDKLNYYVFTIISSILIVNASFDYSRVYNYVLSNKMLRYFGKISYGLYLYHYPVFYLYGFFKLRPASTLSEALILECIRIPAVILLSILSYEFIEKPILDYRKNFSSRSVGARLAKA